MLTVRLPEELENEIRRIAESEHRSKSEIVKEALQAYLSAQRERRSSYELGNDLFGVSASGQAEGSNSYKRRVREKLGEKHAHCCGTNYCAVR